MCDKLMQKAGLICRIVNSTYKVDMDKFEQLCQETYVLALETFPFCNVVDSLHRSWGHISKKMRKMGNRGLVRRNGHFQLLINTFDLNYRDKLLRVLLNPHTRF